MTIPQTTESIRYSPIDSLTGPGEARDNVSLLAGLFPDAVTDGHIDLEVLRGLLGDAAQPAGTETSGLRWVGMAQARQLSTLPATGTLLPRPDESVEWNSTQNVVIEGDNLEVLRLLRRGYTNKVDVIYIDPPYNTGSDFVYDDKLMSSIAEHEIASGMRDDEGLTQTGNESDRAVERQLASAKHAKWLSMMYPRLLVAHSLLKETGVFIAAIDDTEHSRLKLLLDRVFGAENFVSNVVWQGGRKNDSRYVSNGADYMLIYAKNEGELAARGTRWREAKTGLGAAQEKAAQIWRDFGGDPVRAATSWKVWLKTQKDSGQITDSVARYDQLHADSGRPINTYGNITWPGGGGPTYDVLHPTTGRAVKKPNRGWLFKEEEMNRRAAAGMIWFGPDENTIPRGITFLDEMEQQVAISVFEQDRKAASTEMRRLFDENIPFDFPKDHRVLARWISLVAAGQSDALVLDFFAGSGSTGHAVMDLNASDGGSRRFVLVQLDEAVGRDGYDTIADITRERLRRSSQRITASLNLENAAIDLGFRSYKLASSNLRPWDGTGELSLLDSVDNLVEGRSTDDLLVEMMLRLGVELTTPVESRQVAGSTLYSLGGGTLYAFFGEDVTTEQSIEVARALVDWRDENRVVSESTIVVRDTGFVDSSAKLNLDAAVKQAGFTKFRSI